MRTKANESKRYSLRKVKKKDFRSEEMIISDVCAESKKTYFEENKGEHQDQPKSDSNRITGSTKRKKGKPVKTIAKEDIQTEIKPKEPKISKSVETEKISIESNSEQSQDLKTEIPETQLCEDNWPVFKSLYHASTCKETEDCPFRKCSIAKQFITHCAECNKNNDLCTICKAMDIMVTKHAQSCEVTLEKCCPVPRCDKVRLMVLEEWVTLKHKHNEMMQRVFRGLIHAKRCENKSCNLVLCKNIKAVLLHTHTCDENEECKTKQFIIQLCEHHQKICDDSKCDVEFCVENRKIKEHQVKKTHNVNDDSSSDKNVRNDSSCKTSINIAPPFSNSLLSQPNTFQWPQQNMLPLHINTLPYGFSNQVGMQWQHPNVDKKSFVRQNCSPWMGRISSNMYDVVEENKETQNIQQLETSQQEIEYLDENNMNITEEMYYQLLSRDQSDKPATLPRLSPNELQSILMGQSNQLSSPLNSCVENNEGLLLSTNPHCNELEENPFTQTSIHAFSADTLQTNSPLITDKNVEESEIKQQRDWAKIDFMQQKLFREGDEIETETADENDSENEIQGSYVTDCFTSSLNKEKQSILTSDLTPIERSFVNLMEDQKLQFQPL